MNGVKSLCVKFTIFLVLLPAFSKAQEFEPYAFIFGGYSIIQDIEGTKPGGTGTFDFGLDGGWTVGGGIGTRSDMWGGTRFEIEGLLVENTLDRAILITPAIPPAPPMEDDQNPGSDVEIKAAMVNFLKEIPLGCVTGYLGGGIGIASFGIDSQLGPINFFDSDTAFAWQFIAGVEVPVTPCIAVFTQYRLLSIGEVDLNSMGIAFTTDQIYSHSVNVGARYSF